MIVLGRETPLHDKISDINVKHTVKIDSWNGHAGSYVTVSISGACIKWSQVVEYLVKIHDGGNTQALDLYFTGT